MTLRKQLGSSFPGMSHLRERPRGIRSNHFIPVRDCMDASFTGLTSGSTTLDH